MSCKCENCHCDSHCGTECPTCKNDVCQQCECEKCAERPLNAQAEWVWQDSGIEAGF